MATSAQIDKVSYTHEAVADWLLTNPGKKLSECAEAFGYTPPWLSTIIHSDAFQVYYAQRRAALNLVIHGGIASQLQDITKKALQKLDAKLDDSEELDGNFILDVADKMLRNQGYAPGKSNISQTNIVNLPPAGAVDLVTLSRARAVMQAIQKSVGNDPEVIEIVPEAEAQRILAAREVPAT
jgi:hypothetical protein